MVKQRQRTENIGVPTNSAAYCNGYVLGNVGTVKECQVNESIDTLTGINFGHSNPCTASRNVATNGGISVNSPEGFIRMVEVGYYTDPHILYPPPIPYYTENGQVIECYPGSYDRTPEEPDTDYSYQRELSKFNADMVVRSGGMFAALNIPLAVIELRDTPRTLIQGVKLLKWVQGLPVARRAQVLASSTIAATGAYLGVKFGIRPTVADVKDFLDFRKRLHSPTIGVKPRKGGKDAARTVRASFRVLPDAGLLPFQGSDQLHQVVATAQPYSPYNIWDVSGTSSPGLRTALDKQVRYAVTLPSTRGVIYGKIADNPVNPLDGNSMDVNDLVSYNTGLFSTGWELLPFSWLADYVVNVGGFLQRLERMSVVLQNPVSLAEGVWESEQQITACYWNYSKVTWDTEVSSYLWGTSPSRYALRTTTSYVVKHAGWLQASWQMDYERQRRYSTFPPLPPITKVTDLFKLGPVAAIVAGSTASSRQARRSFARQIRRAMRR